MHKAQKLLYSWISMCGNVKYERIKEKCDYLNIQLSLCLDKPISCIFYPLLYSGVIDFSQTGKYRITPPCAVTNEQRNIYIISNPLHTEGLIKTSFVGIYVLINKINKIQIDSSYCFSANKILSNYPSVDKFVRGSEKAYGVNFTELSFIGDTTKGVAVKNGNGIISYFANLNNRECYILSHPSQNPDTKNIAICYDKVINNFSNGFYQPKTKTLILPKNRLPIMIYRVLLIETLLSGSEPSLCGQYHKFENINKNTIGELNRIFCNTINIKDE